VEVESALHRAQALSLTVRLFRAAYRRSPKLRR
jgi:hypothetical protein